MSERTFCVEVFQRLLARPDESFGQALATAADPSRVPVVAAQRAAEFAERVRDLSLDEIQELYDETFGARAGARPAPGTSRERWMGLLGLGPGGRGITESAAELRALLGRDVLGGGEDATPALLRLTQQLDVALVSARNPYHHVIAGLHVILSTRGSPGPTTSGPGGSSSSRSDRSG